MESEVFTTYKQYYAIGKNDHENRRAMKIPSTLTEQFAFAGYMDGYSGRTEEEPKPSKILFKPKTMIN